MCTTMLTTGVPCSSWQADSRTTLHTSNGLCMLLVYGRNAAILVLYRSPQLWHGAACSSDMLQDYYAAKMYGQNQWSAPSVLSKQLPHLGTIWQIPLQESFKITRRP